MEEIKDKYNVVIIGAGPAGSTAATLLGEYGHDVLVVEREKFPRHHIGESLMPHTYWQFQRLGILDKLLEIGFVRKHSVQFVNENGKASKPFYFFNRNSHDSAVTWQVERSKFDMMMLENAEEKGAQVTQETKVVDLVYDDNNFVSGVVIQKKQQRKQVSAQVVIDASGTSAFIARKLKIHVPDPHLKKGVAYTYFRGAKRDKGVDEGATVILHTEGKDGWFWYIPLKDDVVSVGVVGDMDTLFSDKSLDKCGIFMKEVNRCSYLKERIEMGTQISGVSICKDFSYRATNIAGNGYVLIGDAFSFIDPVYSSGILLALKSGEMAADVIHKSLLCGDFSQKQLGSFETSLVKGMNSIKKLVYAFYNKGFSFAKFLNAYPQYQDTLVDILIGDVFKENIDDIFNAMESFYSLPEMEQIESGKI